MYKREQLDYSRPPMLQSPPPFSPSNDTTRTYRWTSSTAANSTKFQKTTPILMKTPEKQQLLPKRADTSYSSPSRGDTWRRNLPSGRTRNLAAVFEQQQQDSRKYELGQKRGGGGGRLRKISEPTYDNEKEEVNPVNFIDDSMIEDREEEEYTDEEYYENVEDIDTDYYDRQTRKESTLESYVEEDRARSSHHGSGKVHRSTIEHLIVGDGGDVRTPEMIDLTPRRPLTLSARKTLNMKMDEQSASSPIITSTPQNPKLEAELKNHFGQMDSIRGSPMQRRDHRRGTQAIVLPPSFDSPSTEKKFKVPLIPQLKKQTQSPRPSPKEYGYRAFFSQNDPLEEQVAVVDHHRKIDAAAEIAELKRQAAERNEEPILEYYDVNHNSTGTTSEHNESMPRIGHKEMRPSIQMGVNAFNIRHNTNNNNNMKKEEIGEDHAWNEPQKKQQQQRVFEDIYTIPQKKTQSSSSSKSGATSESTTTDDGERGQQQQKRQSLPFSDIPEERTCDKIDEMFEFVTEKTGDFDKTLDQTIGYAEMEEQVSPKRVVAGGGGKHGGNVSTHTYQTLDFDKSTRYTEQFENDGTQFTGGSNDGPKFTRSPALMTPHAGQSITEYRLSEKEGRQQTEKVVVSKFLKPLALATSTPIGTMAGRKAAYSDETFVSSISNVSDVDKVMDARKQISNLIESIETTRKHINYAETALIDAKKSRMIVQELAAHRVLLIHRERLQLQLDEVRRLQALTHVRHPPPPLKGHFKSNMTITSIHVNLNKSFNCRGSFAFLVLLKCRTECEATGVVTMMAHYQTKMNAIMFNEHLHLNHLPVDFVVAMEVYMMRVPEYKPPEKTCASLFAEKVRRILIPSAAHRKHPTRNAITSPNRTSISLPAHRAPECEFKFCGKLTLDRDSVGDRHFLLDDVAYPIEGTVKLNSHCSSLPETIDVQYRGYLYLEEKTTEGEAHWEKYWANLNRGIILFWKTPADEKMDQIPLSQIDLTKCTNQTIEAVKSRRPNAFSIELLIDQIPTLLERKIVMLASDNNENLLRWLQAINDTLYVLRSG